MRLNNEPWIPELDKTQRLPLPKLPKEGYTYAIDGATGRRVKKAPAGQCGYSCKICWPLGEEE